MLESRAGHELDELWFKCTTRSYTTRKTVSYDRMILRRRPRVHDTCALEVWDSERTESGQGDQILRLERFEYLFVV